MRVIVNRMIARTGMIREFPLQAVKVRVGRVNDFSAPMEAYNPGWAVECAKHYYEPAILLKVGRGLDAAASQIEISNLALSQNPECVASFGRAI